MIEELIHSLDVNYEYMMNIDKPALADCYLVLSKIIEEDKALQQRIIMYDLDD